jgi:hypothetical protein
MALLSQMFRHAAITGRTDDLNAWFADRQGAQWAEQTVRAALPPPGVANARRRLADLQRSGVLTDAETERLRRRLRI